MSSTDPLRAIRGMSLDNDQIQEKDNSNWFCATRSVPISVLSARASSMQSSTLRKIGKYTQGSNGKFSKQRFVPGRRLSLILGRFEPHFVYGEIPMGCWPNNFSWSV